ncbi:MAG TPA: D-alanyl-D-alanine carboxypeptidase/D-alanyl-D-alanine-endopeptidase, partial [Synechococcales cyanobacterium M55_K2018_004]|nr:D-alanyl-D-alanine carboxypeptidase/D-alanyl-D-alanine-endopeptidase [Synechococcales cyanobacterium M55_K2018_004]
RTVEATAAEFTQAGGNPIHRVVTIQGQLRVGAAPAQEAIAVVNPTENFAQRFRHALAAQDLPVLRLEFATTPSQPSEADEVAAITSPPLVALLTAANQDSENIYAEALLRTLGAVTSPQATEMATETETTTLTAGLTAVQQILSRLGVDPRSYALADGAGLARKNLASPEALVQTLVAIAHTPQATAFRNTLAVAGRSGTLKNRFRGTPLEGKLWGKTGAISGIATLSGYLNPPDHPPLAFSLLVNHFDQPVRTIRPIIDEMVLQVGQLRPCPP